MRTNVVSTRARAAKLAAANATAARSGGIDDDLYTRISRILDEARSHVTRTVNTTMVRAYWLIGREIVEVEQGGKERAGYGEEVIAKLARQALPGELDAKGHAPPGGSGAPLFSPALGWTHKSC